MTQSSDVLVIGAGAIGCAIASELTRRGARVTVADGRGVAGGATQASAGILSPYIEGHGSAGLLELGVRSLAMYDEFVRTAVSESGVEVPYGRIGTLEVATTDEAVAALHAAVERHRARGLRAHLLDAAGVRAAEPLLSDGVTAGLLIEEHAYVAPGALSDALSTAAGRRGASFVKAEVCAIASDGSNVLVDLGDRTVRAQTAVLAAGSWSGRLAVDGLPNLPVRPVRGQLLHLSWSGASLRHITWGARCYMVPWPDGAVLLGATVEDAGFDERATVAGVRDLLDAACELVPQAWQAGFRSARVGLRPASPDEMPIVGRSQKIPGLVYATAHYRNGILLAPLTGDLVARLITEGSDDPALGLMSPQRFGAF